MPGVAVARIVRPGRTLRFHCGTPWARIRDMAERYWISDGVNQAGPFDRAELPQQGLKANSLVWTEGMADWQPAGEVEDLRPLLAGDVDPATTSEHVLATPAPQPLPEAAWHAPQPAPTAPLAYQTMPIEAPRSQAMAITSFVLGLAGFFFTLLPSILAIIFGHIALARIRRGEESGRGLAIAGLVLGYIMVGISALAVLLIGGLFCSAALVG
jgi:hypothetical protein